MEKYFTCMRDGDDKVRFQETDGEPVTIEGFEDFRFFLHHPPDRWAIRGDLWVVSEATTGVSVSGWTITPEQAKSMAKDDISKVGVDGLKERIEKQIENYGLAPVANTAE